MNVGALNDAKEQSRDLEDMNPNPSFADAGFMEWLGGQEPDAELWREYQDEKWDVERDGWRILIGEHYGA
jgi:hypothetical protein